MKKRCSRYATTWLTLQKRYEEKRGQGAGAEYKPWLTVHDVPSRGVRVRVWGFKTKRLHHLLSMLEYRHFLMLEHDPEVVDIQEQYPLPLDLTKAIARELGVDHPWDRATGCLVVMTTDLVHTLRDGRRIACNLKYEAEQKNARTKAKIRIEQLCWERLGSGTFVSNNEANLSADLVRNILWLRGALRDHYLEGISKQLMSTIEGRIRTQLCETFRVLADLTDECDATFNCEPGTSLAVVKWLIAHRWWMVDLSKRVSTLRPLVVDKFLYEHATV